jgi:RNA polymerase sigma factor (sigma-70 family)
MSVNNSNNQTKTSEGIKKVKFSSIFSVTKSTFQSTHNRKSQRNCQVSELSDEIIMNRVKDGNLAELSVLFERYHVKLYNFMLRLTLDRMVSHDLTQNLFYRIIKYRHTYNDNYSFKSWVYQMARNIHYDYCKQQKKYTDQYVPVEKFEESTPNEDAIYHEEEYERLDKALSGLNTAQKEILVLSKFQGLKYEEISVILNSSVPAIKVQVHRALKRLRQIYFKLV